MSGVKTYNWGIPAYQSKSGFRTCPWAGQCATGCYARQGAYIWPNVAQAFETRLTLARSKDFIDVLTTEIRRRHVVRLRVHDSGDFFSPKYRDDWFKIMQANPMCQFYAYTKAIPLFSNVILPQNFTLIYSEGGKLDRLIKDSDRHSRVFSTAKELKQAGYVDTSKNDAKAMGENHKIGLIYHGHKSREWTTNND